MGTLGGTYIIGTIALVNGSVTVNGTGTLWVDAVEGDWISAQGYVGIIDSVNSSFNQITLKQPWAGPTASGVSYVLMRMSWQRYDPSITQANVRTFITLLQAQSVIYQVTGVSPDPGVGQDGNWAIKSSVFPWQVWLHTGGVWVQQSNNTPGQQAPAVTSAATTDIWNIVGDSCHITGTATITSFGTAAQAGLLRTIIFDGAATLTASSNLLLPNGAASLTVAANGRAMVYADTTTKAVVIFYTPPAFTTQRELLTATRTYFVRTDGSDSNTGLVNSSGGAFLTKQKAYNVISSTLDVGGQTVIIQVGDGTYTGNLSINSSWTGGGSITIQGNAVTPDNVLISVTGANAFFNNGVALPGVITIKNLKITTITSGDCIRNQGSGIMQWQNVNFGASAGVHYSATAPGAIVQAGAAYKISGAAAGTVSGYAQSQATVFVRGVQITLGPARLQWTAGFLYATQLSVAAANAATFVGAQTVSMTIASPAVVSWASHGLSAGDAVVFNTSGALPTGVTAGTTYFVIAAGLTANSFEFSATSGGAAVNTSGSQSGVHNAFSANGNRYGVDTNSVIITGSAGPTFLPGNAAGTTATGGQYA